MHVDTKEGTANDSVEKLVHSYTHKQSAGGHGRCRQGQMYVCMYMLLPCLTNSVAQKESTPSGTLPEVTAVTCAL